MSPITGPALQRIAKVLRRPVGFVRLHSLPFYKFGDPLVIDGRPYIGAGKGPDLFELDGTRHPIDSANITAGLTLDDANVVDYLAFYCQFIGRGFKICRGSVLDGHIIAGPVIYSGVISYRIESLVLYDSSLWRCVFKVMKTGEVTMMSDEPVDLDDLPMVK